MAVEEGVLGGVHELEGAVEDRVLRRVQGLGAVAEGGVWEDGLGEPDLGLDRCVVVRPYAFDDIDYIVATLY